MTVLLNRSEQRALELDAHLHASREKIADHVRIVGSVD